METRICGKCHQEKPITEFYTHKRDGHQSRCKACKREDDKERNKQPKRRKYNRQFYERLKQNGYFKYYQQKPEVKERKRKEAHENLNNPKKRAKIMARWYAKRMVRNGHINQEPCAFCGELNVEIHHPDYKQPLLIVWLCSKCHQELHNKLKAEGRR